MKSAPVVDVNVNIYIPKAKIKEEKKYKCSCCGGSWSSQKNHFIMSQSVIYQSNNGYITMCNDCREKYYSQLLDLYTGSEEKAIEHMCKQFGWIYDLIALETSYSIGGRSRLSDYLGKKNLNQTTQYGTTDIDTVKNDYINRKDDPVIIESKEHLTKLKSDKNINVSGSSIERWGGDLNDWDYVTLDEHYKMLKKNNPNCDNNQEIFIKALCNLNWLMMKTLRSNDVEIEKYVKLTDQYSKTFKQAGLKTIEEKDSSNDETFCMTLGFISDYTPEEFYLHKKLYDDNDDLGDYVDRHITRPMINLETGSSIRDKEFFVPEVDNDYEEE